MKKETKERIITIALTAATFAPLLFATVHGFGDKYSEPLSPVAAEAVAYAETHTAPKAVTAPKITVHGTIENTFTDCGERFYYFVSADGSVCWIISEAQTAEEFTVGEPCDLEYIDAGTGDPSDDIFAGIAHCGM